MGRACSTYDGEEEYIEEAMGKSERNMKIKCKLMWQVNIKMDLRK
jgi:hypothetical protein